MSLEAILLALGLFGIAFAIRDGCREIAAALRPPKPDKPIDWRIPGPRA